MKGILKAILTKGTNQNAIIIVEIVEGDEKHLASVHAQGGTYEIPDDDRPYIRNDVAAFLDKYGALSLPDSGVFFNGNVEPTSLKDVGAKTLGEFCGYYDYRGSLPPIVRGQQLAAPASA